MEENPEQRNLNLNDFNDAIDRFDEWFRYAETIGQQRLQSYLQTSAILLAVCAVFLSAPKQAQYSLPFSLIGIVLSLLWIVKGSRQSKFHQMLDQKLGEFLDKNPGKTNFPGYYVREMKSKNSGLLNAAELNAAERWLSTRMFLWLVPLIFLVAYIACMIAAFLPRQ
jgi:hypothetical protein